MGDFVDVATFDGILGAHDDNGYSIFREIMEALTSQGQNSNMRPTRFTAFVTYCYSWYGLACMAIAIVLNRTLVVASTNTSRMQQLAANRRRFQVSGANKTDLIKDICQFVFRGVAIWMLTYNAYKVLMTLVVTQKLTGREDNWGFRMLRWCQWFNYDIDTTDTYYKTPKTQVMIGPSTDMYWPVFLGFCLSSFVETFLSSIEGVKPYTEAGLTIFELSFAFQEASSTGSLFLGDDRITRRPTEELLVICLFSTLNHLNVHIGALINKNKYRLIPSTIIGLGFLGYFASILWQGNWVQFPIIIVGSILPQLLIIGVILLSFVIFVLAIFATGFNLKDLNYASFFYESDQDFQERTFFKLTDDFYTTLLNLGMLSITSAGKSSYITELSIATVDDETWVERSIWQKFGCNLKGLLEQVPKTQKQSVLNYIKSVEKTGYGNLISEPSMKMVTGGEKKANDDIYNIGKTSVMRKRVIFLQMILSNFLQLLKGVLFDKFVMKLFRRRSKDTGEGEEAGFDSAGEEYEFHFEQRRSKLPSFLQPFVKPKQGPQKQSQPPKSLMDLESLTDEDLSKHYVKLLKGTDLSEIDTSIDFEEFQDFEENETENESDIESIGNVETNLEFISPQSFQELISDDSNLQILKSHLTYSSGVMTRSKFKSSVGGDVPKDETTKLIEVLLSKRQGHLEKALNGNLHEDLAEDLSSKLDCVICQVNTREIITWPCKCFSICEGCRLTLASKGMEGCVCCRKDVDGVSRVFIP